MRPFRFHSLEGTTFVQNESAEDLRSPRTRHRAAYEKSGDGDFLAAKNAKNAKNAKAGGPPSSAVADAPFELPQGWAWCRLGEIGSWKAGATPSRKEQRYYTAGNIPWLKTGDLNDGVIDTIPEFITPDAVAETSVRLNPIGSVLIAMYGATIGKIGLLGIAATTNQACCACIVADGIYNKYLFYFLMAQRDYFKTLGGGGAQPNISKDIIVSYPFPLPPIPEQRRIVTRIEELFKVADSLGEAADGLEVAAKRLDKKILDLAIRGKLVPQDPNDEPASELLKRIAATSHKSPCKNQDVSFDPPFPIPQSWEWTKLGDVCHLGNPPISSGQHLAILDAKYLRGKSPAKIIYSGRKISPGEIIILVDGENSGETFIVEEDGYMGSTFKLLDISKSVFHSYIRMFIESKREILRNNKRGATIPHLDKTLFASLPLPLQPLAEQKRIVEKVEQLRRILRVLCGFA